MCVCLCNAYIGTVFNWLPAGFEREWCIGKVSVATSFSLIYRFLTLYSFLSLHFGPHWVYLVYVQIFCNILNFFFQFIKMESGNWKIKYFLLIYHFCSIAFTSNFCTLWAYLIMYEGHFFLYIMGSQFQKCYRLINYQNKRKFLRIWRGAWEW